MMIFMKLVLGKMKDEAGGSAIAAKIICWIEGKHVPILGR